MTRAWIPALLATTLVGCLAGPDYVEPTLPVPEAFQEAGRDGLVAGPAQLEQWWETLDDPLLSELIVAATQGSPTVREARARLREARARRGIAGSDLLPQIGAGADYTRQRASTQTGAGAGGGDRTTELFSTGFDAAWEIDVFGGTRRGAEAAQAELEAATADVRAALVTLSAETALVYVEVRTNQRRLELAERNLAIQRDTASRVASRFEVGFATMLDAQEARAQEATTAARVQALQEALSRSVRRLEVLVGGTPGSLESRLVAPGPIPTPPAEIAVDLPADMLRRRPDIRRAERRVAAQSARVGVASAELYPKFQLRGTIGLSASDLAGLAAGGAGTSSFGPSITWRLFEFGAIRQEIEVQDAVLEQSIASYEAATLEALEETENAMNAFYRDQLRLAALRQAAESRLRAVDAAEVLVEQGLERVERVLDAQRDLVAAQDELALGEAEVTSDVISLYKALGGGW